MKNKKTRLLFVIICLLLCAVTACSKKADEKEITVYSPEKAGKEEIVIQNENLELHFDPVTTHFYVIKKSTGYTWYSNPQDSASDTLAQGIIKEDLQATVSIRYNTESGSATSMNNFGSSIERGNYNYEVLDQAINVKYTIADLEKVYYAPTAVPESRFKEFFNKMGKSAQTQVMNCYRIIDINKLKKDDNKEELLAAYPDLANEPIYVMSPTLQEYLKKKLQKFFEEAGYTPADYETDAARYSTTASSDKPIFDVTIRYHLEDNGLLVTMPLNEIQYKKKYPIVEVRPLSYFGAGSLNDSGFVFVPDGSGGIINFNNKKNTQNPYVSDVFGWDYGISRDSMIDETRANMPVFGVSNKEASFLCILEEGNSYGFIEADVSGRYHNYNYAAAGYNLIHDELMSITAKSDNTVRMFQDKLPDEVITQRYVFLDSNDYVSMAAAYRDYLIKKYPSLKKKTETSVPVAVELLGAVDRTRHIIGIPVRRPDELTSYKEAKDIIEQLVSDGIYDLNIRYTGWFNGGYLHKAPGKVKLVNELGSKKDFKNLTAYADQNKVNLYLDSAFQFVYNNKLTDNFIGIRDSAKFVNRKLIELMPYSNIFFGKADWLYEYNLAKPEYYLKNIDSYSQAIAKLGVKNISFRDIGEVLGADYNPKKEVSREQTKKLQESKLADLASKGYHIMVNTGNIYTVPYADMIVGTNLQTKGYNIIDEEIPFYEIVLHGLVSYTGDPINLANDYESSLLKTVETGAGLYFSFMGADSFELQDSKYTRYFSSDFSEWKEDTKALYDRLQKDMGNIYNQYIVNHKKVDTGVYMTEYEDGTQVIVNYNEKAFNYNGKEIPAKNYLVEGGKTS